MKAFRVFLEFFGLISAYFFKFIFVCKSKKKEERWKIYFIDISNNCFANLKSNFFFAESKKFVNKFHSIHFTDNLWIHSFLFLFILSSSMPSIILSFYRIS